jgi:hypothetical protein
VEKTKEADDGSRYAQQQYEKYHTAYAAARGVSDSIAKSNAAELADLLDERDLIKEIMRMIGAAPPSPPQNKSFPVPQSPSQKVDRFCDVALPRPQHRAVLDPRIDSLRCGFAPICASPPAGRARPTRGRAAPQSNFIKDLNCFRIYI